MSRQSVTAYKGQDGCLYGLITEWEAVCAEMENIMKIKMSKEDFEKILGHAKSGLPDEACGLIAGIEGKEGREIRKVYCLTNADHSNEHFSLDPKEQLAAVKDMRAAGLKPLGNWHSHPESPSRPSQEDIRLAYDSRASYLILSLMDPEHPVLNSFHISGGAVEKEELVIE